MRGTIPPLAQYALIAQGHLYLTFPQEWVNISALLFKKYVNKIYIFLGVYRYTHSHTYELINHRICQNKLF
jgi:hypothetical protein